MLYILEHFKLYKVRKGQRTNQKYRNLIGSDQQMQKLEETELRKADRTVGVNCNIFSNISSGTAWLLQGIFLLIQATSEFKSARSHGAKI